MFWHISFLFPMNVSHFYWKLIIEMWPWKLWKVLEEDLENAWNFRMKYLWEPCHYSTGLCRPQDISSQHEQISMCHIIYKKFIKRVNDKIGLGGGGEFHCDFDDWWSNFAPPILLTEKQSRWFFHSTLQTTGHIYSAWTNFRLSIAPLDYNTWSRPFNASLIWGKWCEQGEGSVALAIASLFS